MPVMRVRGAKARPTRAREGLPHRMKRRDAASPRGAAKMVTVHARQLPLQVLKPDTEETVIDDMSCVRSVEKIAFRQFGGGGANR